MELEEKALAVIRRAPLTYDQLRAELGVSPGKLDEAIANLERSRQVARDRARFHVPGATPRPIAPPAIAAPPSAEEEAEAAMPKKKKPCRQCKLEKQLDEFPKNHACANGRENLCKECKGKYQRAWRLKKAGGASGHAPRIAHVARAALPPPIAPLAKQQMGQLAILHIAGGVRVGPLVTSASGLTQMPYYVDLSLEQLDQLLEWRSTKAIA